MVTATKIPRVLCSQRTANLHCQLDRNQNHHRNTSLSVPVRMFLESFNRGEDTCPRCGQHHPMGETKLGTNLRLSLLHNSGHDVPCQLMPLPPCLFTMNMTVYPKIVSRKKFFCKWLLWGILSCQQEKYHVVLVYSLW